MSYINQYSRGPVTVVKGPPRERLPEVGPPEITLENAVAFVRAIGTTMVKGEVSLPVIELRVAGCAKCPGRGQRAKKPDELGFCIWCGCGGWNQAALSKRVRKRNVKRPKNGKCLWPEGDELPPAPTAEQPKQDQPGAG